MTKYPIEVFWSDEDKGYIAVVPDLPGCSAWGKTEADAIREAQDAIAAWIMAAKSMKRAA
jgi:antitoxin HicB